jgi:hypothetical protein
MAHAFQYTRLRVPHDPFEAEASLCGTRLLQHFSVGGDGGSEFRWHCPEGTKLTGISSGFSPNDNAITRLQPVCGRDGARPERLRGPVFGASSSPPSPFEVTCPSGSAAVGLFGRKDKLVQRLGLVCSAATGGTTRSVARGSSSGTEFELLCPEGTRVMGIVGRAGDLIDQAGIVCGP